MTPESLQKLKAMIRLQEGYRQFPYVDTKGHLTIGYGRNLDANGISKPEADYCLDNDLNFHIIECATNIPVFNDLDDIRQMVLADMSFNMGHKNLLKFEQMLAALKERNYGVAADEMVNSSWYGQVGRRAEVLVAMMRTGQL